MLPVRLTATAKRDIARALRKSKEDFGELRQPGRRAAHFLAYEVHVDRIDILRLMHEHEDEAKALRKFL